MGKHCCYSNINAKNKRKNENLNKTESSLQNKEIQQTKVFETIIFWMKLLVCLDYCVMSRVLVFWNILWVPIVLLQVVIYRVRIRVCKKTMFLGLGRRKADICYEIWDLVIWTYHLIKIINNNKDNYAYFWILTFFLYLSSINVNKNK